jgi:hypothetical protein
MYWNLKKKYNILYTEHLIHGLYVCICVFLFHQESFDMILVNNSSFYDGGVTMVMVKVHKNPDLDQKVEFA